MSYPEIGSASEKHLKGSAEVDAKYGDISTEPDSIGVIAPTLPELPESDSEKGHVPMAEPTLRRSLKSRNIAFIGLGSGIGVGVFVGIGSALAGAGPAGLLMAYIITGALVWTVMQSIGEMGTLFPVAGNFPHYVARFVDPAMGLALGWNCKSFSYALKLRANEQTGGSVCFPSIKLIFSYAMSIAVELSAAALIIAYWSPVNAAVWITVCFIPMIVTNYLPVKYYGELEVATCSIKVISIVGLLLLGLIIDLGGVPGQERIGFRYWRDPGAFVQYNDIPGSLGRFCSFFTAFINAGYSYSGTEVVIISAAEASSPSTQIPKAARRVIYRIALFNCGSALIVGMLVPWTESLLSGGTGNAASSPWVIAISNAGIKALPSIVNAVILTSAWSAGNSFVYVASRTLLGLAAQGHAPKFMLKVDKRGVPYWAVTTTLLLGPLAYLSVGSGGAVKAYSWLQSITALAGILAWGVLCLAYIRLHAAMKAQGISRDTDIPWKSRLQPYGAWFGMILSFVIVIFSGFTVFIKGNWDVSSFFANYISLAIFIVPYIFFKLYWRTKWVRASEADLWTGRLPIEDEIPEPAPTTAFGKFMEKLL